MFPVGVLLFLFGEYQRVALLVICLPVLVFGTFVLLILRVSVAGALRDTLRRLRRG
jgi:hypothetical protein